MPTDTITTPKPKNYGFLKGYRSRAIAELNKHYVLTSLSVRSLQSLKEEIYSTKRRTVPIETVTRHGETISTTKRRAKIKTLIDSAIKTDLYRNALIGSVALTEDFISNYLRVFLTAYPLKISKDKKLGVAEIVSAGDIASALDKLVKLEILSALYKTPKEYLTYFQDILSVQLSKEIVDAYTEIKASRDLLIHNSGQINEVYVEKAGHLARGKSGELIAIDKGYFDNSVTVMKELIHSTFEKALVKHGNSDEISEANNSFQRTDKSDAIVVR